MRFVFLSLVMYVGLSVPAQPYIEGGNTRHRFAQLELGLDVRHFPSMGSGSWEKNNSGDFRSVSFSPHNESRLVIGGTHFWGHSDFYIAFPVVSGRKSDFGTAVEMGARYFPWRIESGKVRPFAGISWQPVTYEKDGGAYRLWHRFPLSAGLVYNRGNHLWELSAGYFYNRRGDYYFERSTELEVEIPEMYISLGYRYMLDATMGAERDWQSGRTARLTDTLSRLGQLNGFTVAAGPSSALFLTNSPYIQNEAPYLHQYRISNVFPEFGIGYYWHLPDIQINLAYRKIVSSLEAYGHSQSVQRRALTLEAYKFVADYHGFAPFIGPAFSREWLRVWDKPPGEQVAEYVEDTYKFGLSFGWDIRPDGLQSWYLRTALRWFPQLDVTVRGGSRVSLDQLEFNFIQLVVFPGRIF